MWRRTPIIIVSFLTQIYYQYYYISFFYNFDDINRYLGLQGMMIQMEKKQTRTLIFLLNANDFFCHTFSFRSNFMHANVNNVIKSSDFSFLRHWECARQSAVNTKEKEAILHPGVGHSFAYSHQITCSMPIQCKNPFPMPKGCTFGFQIL